jgi:hypothetical protein
MLNSAVVIDRETWLVILESALQKPGDQLNDEWTWLLKQLDMGPEEYPVLLGALRQGRWRAAKSPKAYLKTVVRRESLKEQIAAEKQDSLVLMPATASKEGSSVEGFLDHASYLYDTAEAIQGPDGVWRRGGGAERNEYERFDEDEHGRPLSLQSRLLAKVPRSLKTVIEPPDDYKRAVEEFNASTNELHIHPQPVIGINLGKWAEQAGFDEWEMRVLDYQLASVSRDKALAEQPDEIARKALQAAWKRYDRTGKQRLREFAEKNIEKHVPEGADSYTSK